MSRKRDKEKVIGLGLIDHFRSGKRRYQVMGLRVSNPPPKKRTRRILLKPYLFILERTRQDELNLCARFRHWRLNYREQQIVRLILAGQGNRDITENLDLSINTIKGYLKLLMRKLGVKGRAGIIRGLMTDKDPDSET